MEHSIENEHPAISRRELLKGAVAVGVGGAMGGLLAGCSKASSAETKTSVLSAANAKWDGEYDLVVVGAGGAGLSAMVTALENKATAIAIEFEQSVAMSDSSINGGVYMAAATDQQKALGYDGDSVDNFIKYLDAVYEGFGDVDLQHLWANNATPTLKWLMDLGVDFPADEHHLYISGMESSYADAAKPYPRGHKTKNMVGADTTNVLFEVAKKKGGEFVFGDAAAHLYVDDATGRVVGVVTEAGKSYKANKGVLISAAGYSRNKQFIKDFLPSLTKGGSFGSSRQQGDGIRMGMEAGAKIGSMWMPMCKSNCTKLSETRCPANIVHTMGSPCVIVTAEGVRGIAEDSFYETIYDWMAAQKGTTYIIWDQKTTDLDPAVLFCPPLSKGLEKEVADGAIFKADTFEELAGKMGVPKEAFVATLTSYNEMMDKGVDEELGRKVGLGKVSNPPYYASNLVPGVGDTGGGLHCNTSLQVISNFDKPIEGLYAAGTNVSGWRGANYAGSGNAFGWACTSGRLAVKAMLGITG